MGGKARGRLAMRGKEVPADLRAKLRDAVDEDTLGAVIVDTMQGGFHRERLDAVKLILAELAETKKARTLYLRLGTAGATTAPQPVPTATSASPEQCASASPTWSCSASATGCYRSTANSASAACQSRRALPCPLGEDFAPGRSRALLFTRD